jgi:transposase
MSETFSKVEVITGVARRRRFPTELKLAVVAETMQPGMSVSYVARRHGLSPSLVFRWRQLMSEGGKEAVRAGMTSASQVHRAMRGEVRLGTSKAAHFGVGPPSTNSFGGRLLAVTANCRCSRRPNRDPRPETAGIWRMSVWASRSCCPTAGSGGLVVCAKTIPVMI